MFTVKVKRADTNDVQFPYADLGDAHNALMTLLYSSGVVATELHENDTPRVRCDRETAICVALDLPTD